MVKEVEVKAEEEDIKIPKIELEREYEFFSLNTSFPDYTIKIGQEFSISLHMKIVKVLVEFKDIFSWNLDYLGGIPKDITEHKLGIPVNAKPVFQKKACFF